MWIKPLGLLYLGSVLRSQGWEIDLLDCLDRSDPLLQKYHKAHYKQSFTGKFYKETIDKPEALSAVRRYYNRFGLPERLVRDRLNKLIKPDVILLTSGMTYWYPALNDIIAVVREYFTGTPLILGGIYATLASGHARNNIQADHILTGEAENILPEFLAESLYFDFPVKMYGALDDIPFPAFDLYPDFRFLPVLTSRGCPLRCSFCASDILNGRFRVRSPESVVDEIIFSCRTYNIRHVAFYDDALLYNKEVHFLPILESIAKSEFNMSFHTPNGLHANMIDKETAELMVRTGFSTIRLSLDSISAERKKSISGKVSPEGFVQAVKSLETAGYPPNRIDTYVLMGLPDQNVEEVIDTVFFAASRGTNVKLAAFSPIPETKDWERALATGDLHQDTDLLKTNNTVFITETSVFRTPIAEKIKTVVRGINECVRNGLTLPQKKAVLRDILNTDNV